MSIIRFISVVLAVVVLGRIGDEDIRYLAWVIVLMSSALDISIRENRR